MPAPPARLRRVAPVAAAIAILLVAFGTRMLAVGELGVDFDEDDYLRAGQLYATGLQAGDPDVFLRENYRTEHPQLSKIVTGLAITPLPPAPEVPDAPTTAGPNNDLPEPHLTVARTVGAAFGALTAFLLALVSPLGGLWLALHTWSIKYTAQVMLEAVPAFFALLAVVLSTRAWRPGMTGRRRAAWLGAAAVAFGFACGGKYLYGVAGLAIVLDWTLRVRAGHETRGARGRALVPVLAFLALGAAAFLAVNPYLWSDPVGRMVASITYHGGYVGTDAVQDTGWPMWQPLVWLMGSVPAGWQDPSTFVVAVDLLITALALTGLRRLWTEHRVYALWLLLAFVFLLAWPSKWPQYLLVLSAPLCLAAGLGTESLLRPAWERVARVVRRDRAAAGTASGTAARPRGRTARDLRGAFPWLAPGLIALLLLGLVPIAYQGLLSVTDMQLTSLRDGLNGGVLRESIGGLTGQVPAIPFEIGARAKEVNYVGGEVLGSLQQGVWLRDSNTSTATFVAFSVLWMVLAVGLQAIVGIAVALVMERPGMRFTPAWRTLFILPWAIPEVVGAIAWQDIFHPQQGLVAQVMGADFPYRASPEISLAVLLVAATWMGWPLWMLVATAGLRTIPRSIGEAAELDGAGRWRRFRSVTLPLLLPLLSAAFVVRGIATFNQFYLFWVLGPNGNTTTVATWSYSLVRFEPFLYSVSAGVNIVTIAALAIIVVWFLRWRSRVERVSFA